MTRPRPTVDPVPGVPSGGLPVLFLHIPRTGGSTLKFTLQSVYGLDRSLVDAHLFRTAGEDLRNLAFVEGHLTAGFFAHAFGKGWQSNALTMLREPVARTVSQARHIRARPGRLQHHLLRRVIDPSEVFDRVPRLINLQTKQLSRMPIDAKEVGEDALEEAKGNLDRMAFGTTERFDASVALFAERFGFATPRFDVVNAAHGSSDGDLRGEEFREEVRRHNEMDARLHAYGVELLKSRIESYTATLLALPAGDAALTCKLRFRGRPVDADLRVPTEDPGGRLSGWVLLDGRAPDAVLVRAGEQVTPLVTGVERDDAARLTRDLHNRHAGILGTVALEPGVTSVDLIAIDRERELRAEVRIGVSRTARKSLGVRSAMAAKARIEKLRHRSFDR